MRRASIGRGMSSSSHIYSTVRGEICTEDLNAERSPFSVNKWQASREIRVVSGLGDVGMGNLNIGWLFTPRSSVSGESGGISADPLFPLGISVVGGRRTQCARDQLLRA